MAAQDTIEAMRGGADVIYQGALVSEKPDGQPALLGRPDFLVRADLLARVGRGSPAHQPSL